MVLADTLSRAYLTTESRSSRVENGLEILKTQSTFEKKLEQIAAVDCYFITTSKLQEIQRETAVDDTLQALQNVILNGWPEDKKSLKPCVHLYFPFRDELVVEDGVVYGGNRCIIPLSLRRFTLGRIHQAHIEIGGCVRRARDSVFWSGINGAIADYVGKCEVCRTYERRQPQETLLYHEIPKLLWAKVGIDLMSFHERNYLIVVDYFSRFIEVDPLIDTTSKTVISKLKAQFARHGIPQRVVTDTDPQFFASEFQQFAKKWEFDHITTSPYHSQSNGKVESAVKICKHLMVKALEAREDPWMALLDQRNTPPQGTTSPNGLLPMKPDLLKWSRGSPNN